LSHIEGRIGDLWHLADDTGALRTVWPSALHQALARVPGLTQYRAVQEGPAAVRLELDGVGDASWPDGACEAVRAAAAAAGATIPAVRVTPFAHDRRIKLRRVTREWRP
jgi:hypothetical protein